LSAGKLGVMLPGSPYPEQEELRRQIRYAIVSSLNGNNVSSPSGNNVLSLNEKNVLSLKYLK